VGLILEAEDDECIQLLVHVTYINTAVWPFALMH